MPDGAGRCGETCRERILYAQQPDALSFRSYRAVSQSHRFGQGWPMFSDPRFRGRYATQAGRGHRYMWACAVLHIRWDAGPSQSSCRKAVAESAEDRVSRRTLLGNRRAMRYLGIGRGEEDREMALPARCVVRRGERNTFVRRRFKTFSPEQSF